MAKMTLDDVLGAVRTLTRDEQAELRTQIDVLLAEPEADSPEERIQRILFERGLLREIKGPITDLSPYHGRRLVEIQGKPLSETIIEDRR
jgi:hypothetical protein